MSERSSEPSTERSGRSGGSNRPATRRSTDNRSTGQACHYCGGTFAESGRAPTTRASLARHLRRECPDVPGPVRERYRRRRRDCPGGNCDA